MDGSVEFLSPEGLTIFGVLIAIIVYLFTDKRKRDRERDEERAVAKADKARLWSRFNHLEDFTIKFAYHAERAKIKGMNGPLSRDLDAYNKWREQDDRENK